MFPYKRTYARHWKYRNVNIIEPAIKKYFIYRYMPLSIFRKCVKSGEFRFKEPSEWPDRFESRFYTAEYTNPAKRMIKPQHVFAFCTTQERDCDPSWSQYASGEPTIQIKINRQKWLNALNAWAQTNHSTIYEGVVNYDLNESHISILHNSIHKLCNGTVKPVAGHQQIFGVFDLHSYFSLLLFKRKAYKYEQEVRYFVVPRINSQQKRYIDIKVFDFELIEEIRYSRAISKIHLYMLVCLMKKKGIGVNINFKTGGNINVKGKEIPIRPFDINEGTYADHDHHIVIN